MASKTPHDPAYLDTPAAVDDFLQAIAGTPILALDTEGASFHRFVDRIYLLQLSTRDHSAVIDPLPIGTPAGLGRLVEDSGVEIVFHDADYDLRLLHQDYGWRITNIFDTRVAAQLIGHRAFGLAALLERYFDIKLDKKHQRADWSMRPLTKDMLDYAALDTMYLLGLRDQLKAELEAKGRWGWAAEEFARLEGTQWAPEEGDGAFLRLKGARDLNRRELALLRELVQWRDAVARDLDRSTFRVVSNDVLLEIARQAPTARETLGVIKGMPRGVLESRGNEVLAAVRAGQDVADADLPRFPRAPRYDRDPDFDDKVSRLRAARDAAAARLDLDPGVLCSRDRIEAVVRRNPRTADDLLDIPGMRRWQAAELGEAFIRALAATPTADDAVTPPPPPTPKPSRPPRGSAAAPASAAPVAASGEDESPYRDG
jgi:ribonuclease D